jgi:hypothetical protein
MEYEKLVRGDVELWKRKLMKRSSLLNRTAKKAQTKMNGLIPEKANSVITESIKKMVQGALFGSEYLTKTKAVRAATLEELDKEVKEKLNFYKKAAAVEGAGTGGAGILLGLADFPLLLSIKMKYLFEVAALYGYDTKQYEERLFILYVFQLAFSSDQTRMETMDKIDHWETYKEDAEEIDWRVFQQEYRDYLDLVKLLQLVPGIGAIVGAYANYNLMDQLGETALNAYRLRWFNERENDQKQEKQSGL